MKREFTLLSLGSLIASLTLTITPAQTTPAPSPTTPVQTQTGTQIGTQTPGLQNPAVSAPVQPGLGASRNMVPLSGATQMQLDQAPAEVQRILRDQSQGAAVQNVTKGTWNGQTVYQIIVQQNGRPRVVQVAENGTILNGPNGAAGRIMRGQTPGGANLVPLTGTSVIEISQVPAEVQRMIRDQAGAGGTVQTVTKGQWNGETVYQAIIVQNGRSRPVQIAANGTILNRAFGAQAPARTGGAAANSSADVVALTGATKIQISQVPAEVQRILRDQAQGGTIQTVTKGTWNGQPVYQAEIVSNGTTRQVQVEENGTILNKSQGATRREVRERNLVPLTGSTAIDINQVPAEVQRILRDQAQGANIQSVAKGQWNGQTVYQATIDQNGKTRQVQVEQNGTILNGPRGRR